MAENGRLHVFVVAGVVVLLGASPIWAEYEAPPAGSKEYRVDLAYGGHWRDAEKTRATSRDDWACWAAPAANILAWTGWGAAEGFADEDAIFAHFVKHLAKTGVDSPREAWNWWFCGKVLDKDRKELNVEGGGFHKDVAFPEYTWESPKGALYRGLGCAMIKRRPLSLKKLLDEGYGVAIQIVRPAADGGRDSHMITLWGYTYDDENAFNGIVVSDSDDAKENRDAGNAPNALRYHPVTLVEGMWWFEYDGREWQILAAYALARKEHT